VPVCVTQEIATTNSLRLQGQPTEFSFYAKAGPNFSAANSNLNVSIVWGTGTDEGISKLAFQFNGGGGGSSTWAGQTNAASNLVVPISSAGFNRVGVAATIPATATEVAAIICYTPVGTGVAGDWFEFTGAQMVPNAALAGVVGASGVVLNSNDVRMKSFARRPAALEAILQYQYTYAIAEAAAGVVQTPVGSAQGTTTTCTTYIPFPVAMRAAPTYTNALTVSTFKLVSASQAATALSTPFSATLVANTVNGASINFTTTGMTAKDSCFVVGAAGTGTMVWSAEL
jgi:hypothetical protein